MRQPLLNLKTPKLFKPELLSPFSFAAGADGNQCVLKSCQLQTDRVTEVGEKVVWPLIMLIN